MDWRWLLFSLVAAAIAAVRLRRKPPPEGVSPELPPTDPVLGAGPASGPEPVPSDNVGPVRGADEGTDTGTDEARHRDGAAGAQPPHPAALTGDQGLDRSLDQALDTAFGAAREPGGVDAGRAGGHRNRPPGHGADAPRAGDRGDAGDAADAADAGDPVGPEALDAALERVWAEHAGDADTLLAARLRLLVHRGVPARALRPAPGTRTVRVVFADGTVVLCRGTGQGDFGRLGLAMLHHSVRLGSFRSASDGGTRLEFRWHPDQRLAAVAVGLDQPD
jgi:hypothetical protein